ncbi:PhzF family phenazine biosynthesis protein [Agilicoccus flavus]|uniref:PhzF family phenazine biosynthesis protein n=1 Tax=Agilicoccus flavus TaxID=2775968 RepID=UPI001CF6B0E5|nr:PhzF family phenazine biosynthesis protein [Agilicoccus flavus]
MDLTYRLLNVFTDGDDPFAGNGVAVFEDAQGVSDELMQALATQVNTETVFIKRSDEGADADVRFFSPEKETGFIGSASLATAAVVRDLIGGTGDVVLRESERGTYTVSHEGDLWVIAGRSIKAEPLKATPQILASLVGLKMDAINGEVMSINHGKMGIVLPVRNVDDVRKTRLDARLLHSYAMLLNTEPQVYVWAPSDDRPDTIVSRMFYGPRGGVLEVAATGTGGLNLGAWLSAHGERGIHRTVLQGRASGRRSLLDLRVDDEGLISVGGRVTQVAKGTFAI